MNPNTKSSAFIYDLKTFAMTGGNKWRDVGVALFAANPPPGVDE